jgi:hypothetical protein
MPSKKLDFDSVRVIALALPGVEEGTLHGAPSLKVAGRPGAPQNQSAPLLAAQPSVYYLTDHYINYPTVLVRLSRIRRDALRDLLTAAWRFVGLKGKGTTNRLTSR